MIHLRLHTIHLVRHMPRRLHAEHLHDLINESTANRVRSLTSSPGHPTFHTLYPSLAPHACFEVGEIDTKLHQRDANPPHHSKRASQALSTRFLRTARDLMSSPLDPCPWPSFPLRAVLTGVEKTISDDRHWTIFTLTMFGVKTLLAQRTLGFSLL
jgi:hypothetical protein